ncbi:hypothetical protein H6P81_010328 [Aristolochia fimbriata]|uniref:Uncharacterized protein n=1 Tax=Aristolochia fimbriata TaxID=158543 RepID=A0AAV7ESX3_ARIFI|nr:hypothetical protein H6P81_010328 [Aristolochia fimbriata]
MSTLQRSSFSFRRQGSSGRIWENQVNAWELKGPNFMGAAAAPAATTPPLSSQHVSTPPAGEAEEVHRLPEYSQQPNIPPTPPVAAHKKSGFSAFFRLCVKPHPKS